MTDVFAEFKVEKRGDEFCAVSEDGETSFGCFPTEAEAKDRLKQVEAAKKAKGSSKPFVEQELFNIDGVEIFRTGTWNGDKYTAGDLDDMVAAFAGVGFKPPVKLGHKDSSGDPAYGWVESVRRSGDILIASFTDLPKSIFEAIKNKRFNAVSSEVFFNLKRNGVKFRRALKAVALLGAEIPAVSGLKPLHDSFRGLSAESESVYTLQMEDFSVPDKKVQKTTDDKQEPTDDKKLTEAVAEIAKLTAQLSEKDDSALEVKRLTERVDELNTQMAGVEERRRSESIRSKVEKLRIPVLREHVAAFYELATTAETKVNFTVDDKPEKIDPVSVVDDLVERLNKHTEKLFSELSAAGNLVRDDAPRSEDASGEVHSLTQEYMRKNDVKDYQTAMDAVLDDPENRDLKAKYAGV